jgi:hypothetical protein
MVDRATARVKNLVFRVMTLASGNAKMSGAAAILRNQASEKS